MSTPSRCTRLAPTPSGALHLGHAVSFLVAWGLARNQGWRVILRIEDIDASRCTDALAQAARDELRWLGMDWDEERPRQSCRRDRHIQVMRQLAQQGEVFHAPHTRRELRQASGIVAPHAGDESLRFDASLRPLPRASGFEPSIGPWRMRNDAAPATVHDGFLGDHTIDSVAMWGDPIVWTRDGYPSYQAAVTIDDGDDEVTDVVRGADLLPSSSLQATIHQRLGRTPPRWWHVPVVLDEAGQRLAKRSGAAALAAIRGSGVSADELRGRAGRALGLWHDVHGATIDAWLDACAPPRLSESLAVRQDGIRVLP